MNSKVLIRKPCAQDLDGMPRTSDGIFCTVCKTKVQDLTRFSDGELVQWMAENVKTKPCGIYTNEQARIPVSQRMLLPVRYAAISIASLFFAKTANANFTENCIAPLDTPGTVAKPVDTMQQVIRGKVLSKKHEKGMPLVTVYIAGSDSDIARVTTREDGSFECVLPYTTDTSYTLTFNSKGYNSQVCYGYVPCDRDLVVHMKKSNYRDKHKRRRVYSKF